MKTSGSFITFIKITFQVLDNFKATSVDLRIFEFHLFFSVLLQSCFHIPLSLAHPLIVLFECFHPASHCLKFKTKIMTDDV